MQNSDLSQLSVLPGSQYWKFDPSRTPHVRRDKYPRSVSLWDLPDDIDGALQWDNRRTYFFKQVRRSLDHATTPPILLLMKGEYWRFNDRKFSVDFSRSNPFPRPTGETLLWRASIQRTRYQGLGGSDVLNPNHSSKMNTMQWMWGLIYNSNTLKSKMRMKLTI